MDKDIAKSHPKKNEAELSDLGNSIVERIDRRHFLIRFSGLVAAITVSGASVGALLGCQRGSNIKPGDGKRWSSGNALPNANASVQPVPGTRPEFTPLKDHYKMFNKPVPPEPVIQDWRLRVNNRSRYRWTISSVTNPFMPSLP